MRVLVIPDTHVPFHHPRMMEFLRETAKEYRTDTVVHLGDLGDQHAWSRFGGTPDAPGAGEEAERTAEALRDLYKRFPVVLACVGNHDERMHEAMIRANLPAKFRPSIPEIYVSPDGWKWRRRHVIDRVVYQHGTGFGGQDAAIRAVKINLCSTVIGHVHSAAGIRWFASLTGRYFGLAVGCLINPLEAGFHYAREHAARPMLGCAVVLDGTPHYIPLPGSELDGLTEEERQDFHVNRMIGSVSDASESAAQLPKTPPDDWKDEIKRQLKTINQKVS